MLDIDGTLCDLVERPHEAAVPDSATIPLRTLIAKRVEGVHVAFVTGRSVADAQRMLGIDGVAIYGNHGMERSAPAGNLRGSEGSEQADEELRNSVPEFAQIVSALPGTSMEDKHFSLSLHYREMEMERLPELNSRVVALANRNGLRLSPGKCVINILPAASRTKGDAVREIVHDTGGASEGASILFVGDDTTDEDAFRELEQFPDAVTVRVGEASAESSARLSLADPQAVHNMLALLAESRV